MQLLISHRCHTPAFVVTSDRFFLTLNDSPMLSSATRCRIYFLRRKFAARNVRLHLFVFAKFKCSELLFKKLQYFILGIVRCSSWSEEGDRQYQMQFRVINIFSINYYLL